MNKQREVKTSNSVFESSMIAKIVAVAALVGVFSLYFQNIGALIALTVLIGGVCVGNMYERRH